MKIAARTDKAKKAKQIRDCLQSLTPEELAKVKPLTVEEIEEALLKGKGEQDRFLDSLGKPKGYY